jgi:predicted PurR-regulated permease PerM
MATSKKIKKAAVTTSQPKRKVSDFGVSGLPINKTQPFYFGFVATLGVLSAIVLLRALESVSQIFVLILVSLFLATGLNPAVEALRKRNFSRGSAVAVIFSSVILFVVFLSYLLKNNFN